MSNLDDARNLIYNKMCVQARNGRACVHEACEEASLALQDIDAGTFTDLARTVLTNRLCQPARQGANCGHATCAEIQRVLATF
jgi:hypothetical protein